MDQEQVDSYNHWLCMVEAVVEDLPSSGAQSASSLHRKTTLVDVCLMQLRHNEIIHLKVLSSEN